MSRHFYIPFLVALCISFAPVTASPMSYGDGGLALQAVFDSVTVSPHPGLSSVHVLTDSIDDGTDKWWHITATGGSIATVITPLASGSGANTFGVYDIGNPADLVPIHSGVVPPGQQALLSVEADGSVWVNFADTGIDFTSTSFGYYLDTRESNGGGNLWYSDTALNGGEDHMVAFQGTNTDTLRLPGLVAGVWMSNQYVLGFEHLPLASSSEYSGFVVMVESVYNPPSGPPVVPVPGAALLVMFGAGIVEFARRSRYL